MSTYQVPLSSDSIRLLRLRAGSGEDALRCSFSITPLDDSAATTAYEAISYLWGDARDRKPVETPAGNLYVTANSDAALRRFRYPDRDRVLWMDQLCINQQDLAERSAQVSLMWKTYSRAERVLMWLGPDQDGLAALCQEFIQELQSRYDRPARLLGEFDHALALEGLPPQHSVKWRAYKRLMALPYFTRVWMLQEVLLSTVATAFWGDVEIPWLHIARAASWGAESFALQGLHSVEDAGFVIERDCTMVRQLHDGNDASDFPGCSLGWMIGILAYREASDPRDKIFAILNLVPEHEKAGIPVDYSRSALDVFRQATLHIISLDQSLNVLQNASLTSSDSRDEGWPSWVPRWGEQEYAYVCGVTSKSFLPCLERPIDIFVGPNRGVLEVSGTPIGSIVATTGPRLTDSEQDVHILLHEFESPWKLIKQHSDSAVDPLPLALQLICTLLACEADHPDADTQEFVRQEYYWAFVDYFCYTAVHNDPKSLRSELLESVVLAILGFLLEPYNAAEPHHRDLADRWKTNARLKGLDAANLDYYHRWIDESAPPMTMTGDLRDLFISYMSALQQNNKVVSYDSSPYAHFFKAYEACGTAHRFFVTDDGRMGMGNQQAEVGDVVAILNGASVPFLLRPVGNRHLVVGSCYCYSVMHGEYARKLEAAGRTDEEIVRFRLV